jgi:alpha-N-arabinofuranosidase
LRFPGGSLSNDYHWQTNTTGTDTWQWPTSFDDFAHVATATAAQVFISVNYGSGTPAEAADWVRYANVTRGYRFKHWEIGNENYGAWETDVNVRPHDPFRYASRFRDYYQQMKAVDSTIKVGAVAVTGEDSFPTYTDHPATNPRTGQAHNGWTPVMLATLKSLGVTPDFLIYHRYPQAPGAESDAGLLQSSTSWGADAADLRQQLTDYLGAGGAGVELVCTENNSVFTSPGKQTTSLVNGLFLADSIVQAMKTELNAVLWWDLRNGPEAANNNAASLYGWRLYGDYGSVNDATPAGPADRYPTFYAAKLLQYFARGGDRLVEAGSDYGLLSIYAARRLDGSLTLLALNKSSTTTLNANIVLRGYSPNGTVHTYSYGIPQDEAARTGVGSADIAAGSAGSVGSTFAFPFPPNSVTVLSLNGAPSVICCRDFNGDGRADILWRHTSGTVAVWLLNGPVVIGAGVPGAVASEWSVVGAGDFNGDGKVDVLWRHISGSLAVWLLDGAAIIGAGSPGSVGNEWTVAGVADFNGDGKVDILWRHTGGTLAVWPVSYKQLKLPTQGIV